VHGADGFGVEVAELSGQAVAQRGLLGGEAGGVEFDARAGDFGEGAEFVGVVPDEAEIVADLVDEAGGGGAAAAVLERGEVGGGDGQGVRHVALADVFLGAQDAEFFAEGGHRGRISASGGDKQEVAFLKKSSAKNFC